MVEQAGGVLGQVAVILVVRPAARLSERVPKEYRPTQPSVVAVRPVARGDVASDGSEPVAAQADVRAFAWRATEVKRRLSSSTGPPRSSLTSEW